MTFHVFETLVKISGDFVDQNVENVQQQLNALFKMVVRGDKVRFLFKNATMSPKSQKIKLFLQFCDSFNFAIICNF